MRDAIRSVAPPAPLVEAGAEYVALIMDDSPGPWPRATVVTVAALAEAASFLTGRETTDALGQAVLGTAYVLAATNDPLLDPEGFCVRALAFWRWLARRGLARPPGAEAQHTADVLAATFRAAEPAR